MKFKNEILWFIAGVFASVILIMVFCSMPQPLKDSLKILSSFIIAASVGIAAQQFRFNRKQAEEANRWNKKQLGITEVHKSRSMIKKSISELQGIIDILDADYKTIPLYEIHNAFGVFVSKNEFIFHGTNTEDANRKIAESNFTVDKHHIRFLRNDIDGKSVRENLWILLGEYEYICNGMNDGIFDKKIIMSLIGMPIVKTYVLFYEYIHHLRLPRTEFGHGYPTAYIEIEKIAKETLLKMYQSESIEDKDLLEFCEKYVVGGGT